MLCPSKHECIHLTTLTAKLQKWPVACHILGNATIHHHMMTTVKDKIHDVYWIHLECRKNGCVCYHEAVNCYNSGLSLTTQIEHSGMQER